MQSLKIFRSGCLAAVNSEKIFSRKSKTFIFNTLSTFSRSKTLILNSQTPRSFSVAAVPTPTTPPPPPISESAALVQTIESSRRIFIKHLVRTIDPSILSSPVASTDLTKALECFYSMKEKMVLPKIEFDEFIRHMETLGGMKPSIFTYTKGKKKLEAACVMFMTTKDVGLFRDGYSYNHFSFVTCKEGRLEEASDLLSNMLELGLVPHELTYDALIHGCGIDHDMYKAIEYKDEMISRGIEPSLFTYSLLLDALFERGYSCEAGDVIKEMHEKGMKPDIHTYNIMISGYFKCKYDGSSFIYDEMVEKRIQQPTLVTYNNVLLGYCRDGNMKEAQGLFDEMKARGIKPDHISYNLLIDGYSSDWRGGGDLKEAFRVLDEMLKNGVDPTITTYKALMLGLGQNHKLEHAKELLREMVSKDICTPHDKTYQILEKILSKGTSGSTLGSLSFEFLLENDRQSGLFAKGGSTY